MNRESINPDDPQMTAYALGEMSIAEAAEFEARLKDSPMARAELSSMREIMGLLSEGLRGEWQASNVRPTLMLLDPVQVEETEKIVVGNFRPARRTFAAAAAIAGMLLVGGMVVNNQKGATVTAGAGQESDFLAASVVNATYPASGAVASVHVPQLFLANEVEDMSKLDLADDKGSAASLIDATYLDAGQIIPASFTPGGAAVRGVSPDRGQAFDERVDSYLPPLPGRALTTGMIEKRLSTGYLAAGKSSRGNSVLVNGYVTMGGGLQHSNDEVLTGFRPVSISENPVVNEGADLQFLSDLNALQKDLSSVVAGLPEGSAERAKLEGILEESHRIVSELKREMAD